MSVAEVPLDIQTPTVFIPLLQPVRHKGAFGGRGSGKCLALGTEVMMADGSVRAVEDVAPGDQVMGPDGAPREVFGVTRGRGPMYRVAQAGSGSYVVNDAHLLSLRRGAHGIGRYPGPDVLNVTAAEYLNWSERKKASFFGYKAGPIEMPAQNLPIPPYVLGAWLGDGCSDRQSITSMDEEIICAFVAWGESHGCREVRRHKPGQRALTIIVTNIQGQPNPAREALRDLGVLGNKHIPEIYHRSTLSDRLALLAGFIDTDGSLDSGCFTVIQKSLALSRSIKRIADSCGFKASLRPKATLVNGERRPYYRVNIGGDIDRIPVRLPRKVPTLSKNKDWLIGRLTVEPIGEGEYAGFELGGDHLFCLADGTVTHNSHFFAEYAIENCMQYPGTRGVCVREVQKSLRESVKLLLEDKIRKFGVERHFRSLHDRIIAPGNGIILFQGMQDHNAESIKSLEGFDWAYVEEAQTLSSRSLELLRPTIRNDPRPIAPGSNIIRPGSELWYSWNPRSAADAVDELLRGANPPANSAVIRVNYRDNPFFPKVLEEERLDDRLRKADRYDHIWEGAYEPQAVGAIWTRDMIRQARRSIEEIPDMGRVLVAVDPAIESHEGANETGIVGGGLGTDARGYLLRDASMHGTPEQWGRAAVALYDELDADAIVAETNQGGDMVRAVIHAVRPTIRVIMVRATRGKHVRAEPISALYATDRISHVGTFPELEAQMCLFTAAGWEGDDDKSPDRADAMIWLWHELFPRLIRNTSKEAQASRPTRTNKRNYSPARWRR